MAWRCLEGGAASGVLVFCACSSLSFFSVFVSFFPPFPSGLSGRDGALWLQGSRGQKHFDVEDGVLAGSFRRNMIVAPRSHGSTEGSGVTTSGTLGVDTLHFFALFLQGTQHAQQHQQYS